MLELENQQREDQSESDAGGEIPLRPDHEQAGDDNEAVADRRDGVEIDRAGGPVADREERPAGNHAVLVTHGEKAVQDFLPADARVDFEDQIERGVEFVPEDDVPAGGYDLAGDVRHGQRSQQQGQPEGGSARPGTLLQQRTHFGVA